MPTVANLAVSVTAKTSNFRRGMERSRRNLRGFSKDARKATLVTRALSKAFKTAAGVFGAAILGRGILRAARSVDDFNQSMRSSLAIMGDVSNVMRSKMAAAALEVAKTTRFSGQEAAKAFFFLASAGLDAQQSIAAIPLVSKFAQAGMFDLATATDLVTDAQSALGLTVKDAGDNLRNMTKVADILVKANTLANASVQQFSEALTTKVGASLKFYNKSLEEGVAVLAVFADQGIKGAEAGTAFDIVLRQLTTRAIVARKAFRDYNIEVFRHGKLRNVADIIEDLERALGGQGAELKKTTLLTLGFQQKSISALRTLLGMSDAIRGYEAALSKAGGTTADVASKQLTPLNKALELAKGSFLEFATSMTPVINQFAQMTTNAVKTTNILKTLIAQLGVLSARAGRGIAPQFLPPGLRALRFAGGAAGDEGLMGPPAPPAAIPDPSKLLGAFRIARIFLRATFNEWTDKLAEFNKRVDSVGGIVKGLFARMQTPAERLAEQMDALQLSFVAGKVNAIQYARALAQAKLEFERIDKIGGIVRGLFARMRTPTEQLTAQLDALQSSLAEGLINAVQYGRALAQAQLEFKRATKESPLPTISFQQISLRRTAISGVNAANRPQLVRDPQIATTNDILNRIKASLAFARFGLTS